MYKRLYNFLKCYNILNAEQFGFRPGHATNHATTLVISNIADASEKKLLTIGVFLDLSKVFDTIDLTWANYGPRAKSGPRACLIWPACYYHERVLKSNSLLIVEYSFPFPYRKITFQCPSIRIN